MGSSEAKRDLEQYEYRRHFPFNNTIREDTAENLSENQSTITLNSLRAKRLMNDTLLRQVRKMEFLEGNVDIIRESAREAASEAELSLGLQSEKLIRNFEAAPERDAFYKAGPGARLREKKVSERCIRSSDEAGGSSKQVRRMG